MTAEQRRAYKRAYAQRPEVQAKQRAYLRAYYAELKRLAAIGRRAESA